MSESDSDQSGTDQQNNNQANNSVQSIQNNGFSLYVRSSDWIKDRKESVIKLKEMDNRIIGVRHPRQKSANYCFIDFASATDRDSAYQDLLAKKDFYVKPVTRDNPVLLKKKVEAVEAKRSAKQEMRKLLKGVEKVKKVKNPNPLSNQILIQRLSKEATKSEIVKLFPGAIEVKLRAPYQRRHMASAVISFSTPGEAGRAAKKEFELHNVKSRVILLAQREHKGKSTRKIVRKVAKKKVTA